MQAPQALQDSRLGQQFSGVSNNVCMNLAFFPFRTRDGSAPKPGSPEMSGSIQFTMEQLAELYRWASQQAPDAYGKIRIGASLWRDQAQATGMQYLKGNAKMPLVASSAVQAMPSQTQAAQAQVQAQVWPHVQTPQTPGPNSMVTTGSPNPHSLNGNPLPAWTNQQAFQQQNGQAFSTPRNAPSGQQPLASASQASPALQPPSAPVQDALGTPPGQPTTSPQGQHPGSQEIPF